MIAFSLPTVIYVTVTATPILNRKISAADFAVVHEEKTDAFPSFIKFSSSGHKVMCLVHLYSYLDGKVDFKSEGLLHTVPLPC